MVKAGKLPRPLGEEDTVGLQAHEQLFLVPRVALASLSLFC